MAKKNTPDTQANMVDFVQKFARSKAPEPTPSAETQPDAEAAAESQATAAPEEHETNRPAANPTRLNK